MSNNMRKLTRKELGEAFADAMTHASPGLREEIAKASETTEGRNALRSTVIVMLVEKAGYSVKEAMDLVFGDGTYSEIARRVWEHHNPQSVAQPVAA